MRWVSKLLLASVLVVTSAVATAAPSGAATLRGAVSTGAGLGAWAIAGADVTVYEVRRNGPQALASATTDVGGKFAVTVSVANAGDILYAIARHGPAVELMTVIGTALPPSIAINEMTTVGAAYAMAQLFRNGTLPYAPLPLQVAAGMAANLVSATTGLPSSIIQTAPNGNQTNTWRSLGTLANILAACVRQSPNACMTLFGLTTVADAVPQTTLAAMVSIARHPATNVGPLFALSQTAIAYQPYLDAAGFGPEAANELQRLDAFTLAVKVDATGRVDGNGQELCPFGGPGNLVFDVNGDAWITNNVVQGTPYSAQCLVVLKPNGQPTDGTGGTPVSPVFGGGILGQGFGLGFAPSHLLWSGNFGWGGVDPTNASGQAGGSVSTFSDAGAPLSPPHGFTGSLYKVQGTVSDKLGNIWMASYGNSRVQVFRNGNPASPLPYYADANTSPFDIRIDDQGFGWVSYTGTSAVAKFQLTKNGLQRLFTVPVGSSANPKGLAVDANGNAWVAAGALDAVYAFDRNGHPLGSFTGGGLVGPWGVSLDSSGHVWVANFGGVTQLDLKYRVSELCGAETATCPAGSALGDPISPDTGYTLPSGGDEVLLHNGNPLYSPVPAQSYKPLMRLTSVHVDMAGNVWCTNNWKPSGLIDVTSNPGGDGIVIFVGLAAPVLPVLYSAPPTSPLPPS